MNLSKQIVEDYAKSKNFISYNIEKVIRLIDVLKFIFNESSFRDDLVLKGGTAINLVYTNLKRLSVDIDLDYRRSIDKEIASSDKAVLADELDQYMLSQGYNVSAKSRTSVALVSRYYSYTNSSNNTDYIKVDINFLDRVGIFDTFEHEINYFDRTAIIKIPCKEELYGMKMAALLNRCKPRDLYDIYNFFLSDKPYDKEKLKRCALFYLSLDNVFDIDESTFKIIDKVDYIDIKKELYQVISKTEKFNLEETKELVKEKLKELFVLSMNEKLYLKNFKNGVYIPHLLFDNDIADKLKNHPMAKWKELSINKHKEE